MELNNPEATAQALAILRKGAHFHWNVIALLALVLYVYLNEYRQGNFRGIAAGLSLYMVHWSFEIANALVQHFSGHALWTVPTGTSFLLLVGVGVELSFMFSIAGLVLTKVLPEDRELRILGIPNRILFALGNAAFFSVFEIFLAKTPAFVWVYPWWGALPVFLTTYIPFFMVSMHCYDWRPRTQATVIGGLFAVNVLLLVVCAGVLGWI